MPNWSIPEPIRLDDLHAGSLDARGVDLTGGLVPYNDKATTINSISVISRDDGASLLTGDLMVVSSPAPAIDPTGMMASFYVTSDATMFANGVTVDYLVRLNIGTEAGRTLIVDCMILVTPIRG